MERRKSKILSHFDEIIEERSTLEKNLERVISQVFSCVDHINSWSGEIKQKYCSLILKHELEVLKKLTEINYELEDIIEQNPLEQLKITEKEYKVDKRVPEPSGNSLGQLESTIKECEGDKKVPEPIANTIEQLIVFDNENEDENRPEIRETVMPIEPQRGNEHPLNEFSGIECSPAHISNNEMQSNLIDIDIQDLRDEYKKFSEKLGFNAESIPSMKDYFEKLSTSCKREVFDVPSNSHNAHNYSTNCTSFETSVGNNFEIPEKDTNVALDHEVDLSEECSNSFTAVESDIDDAVVDPKLPESNSEEISTDANSVAELVSQNKIYCADVSTTSTETEILNSIRDDDDNCSKGIDRSDRSHCPLSLSRPNNDLISSVIDGDDDNKTEVSISEPKKIVYTALEKLNNTKINDRREAVLDNIKQAEVPDIKLRPAELQVIKNNLEIDSKSKKKKNKKENDKGKHYELKPKPTPQVGADCAISHVESPSEFYIHVVDEESSLVDALTEQIKEYFQNTISEYSSKEEACSCIPVGTYCFAFILEYDGWYRAQVLDWDLDGKSDNVLLQLVDFGNKRSTPYNNIRKMNKEMADIPMLAIRCHLPLLYPPQTTRLNRLTEWPSAAIDAIVGLSGLFQENKIFKIVYAHDEGESIAIDLYNQEVPEPEHTVGQILLDLGLAIQIIDDVDEQNVEVEEYLQDVDILETADNINEAITGYDPRDEARICRFTKKDGTCYKGKHCKLEHVPLSKDGFTTDTEPVFREAMYSLQLPTNGEVVNVLITAYKDPCNFFAIIVRNPQKVFSYDIEKEFYALLETMSVAKTVRAYESFKVAPAIGEIVVVKHSTKKWLRAVVRDRIIRDDESEEYQVFTLDIGDYVNVPLSDLRKIKPNFLQLPFQAIECYIAKYEAKRNCDAKKAHLFFQQNLLFHNFVAIAMSEALPLKVGLKAYNGIDVGAALAERGFAQERIIDINQVDGCPLELY